MVTYTATNASIKWHKDQERAIQEAIKQNQKSLGRWLLYAVTGLLPMCTGLFCIYRLYWKGEVDTVRVPTNLPDYITDAVPYFILFIALEIAVAFFMKKPEYYRFNDSVSSISMGMVQQATGIFLKPLFIFPYAYLHQHYKIIDLDDEEITWRHPLWWAMFVTIEFGYYWLHRFAHEWNALWAGHMIHHSSEEYNLSTALRQGWFQQVYGWVFSLIGAPIFPIPLFVFHSQVNTLYQFWIHTQVIGKFPAVIEFIFNTPSHHRVHHGRNPQYIDKNYGGTLIIFDRLFGTFEPEKEEVVYGITHTIPTWNPIYGQLCHWMEMIQAMKRTPGIWNKIRVFLDRGPGYNYVVLHPEYLDNPPPKPTRDTVQKYDSQLPNLRMSVYVFIHFGLLILYLFFTLLTYKNNTSGNNFIHVCYVIFGIYSISTLFDRTWFAKSIESLRLISLLLLVIYDMEPQFFSSLDVMVLTGNRITLGCIALVAISLIPLLTSKIYSPDTAKSQKID